MIYAVIDTNVLVSAMLTHNKQSATFLVMEAMFANKIIPLYKKRLSMNMKTCYIEQNLVSQKLKSANI